MSEINLPFKPAMQEAILAGKKSCTSRYKRYGNPGDTFEMFGQRFILTSVIGMIGLGVVANQLFREEGFDTPEAFWETWRKLHPRRTGFGKNDDKVWVHRFRKLEVQG